MHAMRKRSFVVPGPDGDTRQQHYLKIPFFLHFHNALRVKTVSSDFKDNVLLHASESQ